MKTFVLLATVAFAASTALGAQGVTTAAIAGVVSDSSGGPLEGARVVAVHGPSGTAYAAVTRADGRFTIPGMRVLQAGRRRRDRKSTRLNSSHRCNSYGVFCLKKKT